MSDYIELEVGMYGEWDNYPERIWVVKIMAVDEQRGMARIVTISKDPKGKPLHDQWVSIHSIRNPIKTSKEVK